MLTEDIRFLFASILFREIAVVRVQLYKSSLNIMFHGAMKEGPDGKYTITILCYKGEMVIIELSFVMLLLGINFRWSPVFSAFNVYVLL